MDELKVCEICGEPMPDGETMFKFHGYSGPCPKPPLPKAAPVHFHDPAVVALVRAARSAKVLTDSIKDRLSAPIIGHNLTAALAPFQHIKDAE